MQLQADGLGLARFRAMASPCELLVDGCADIKQLQRLAATVAGEAWRIERLWSRYSDDSMVQRINRAAGAPVVVDAETAQMLDFAARLYGWSDGLFDITSGVLRAVWTFDGSDRVPDAAAIEALLPRLGWHRVRWSAPILQLPAGMEIDFGGLGKEYAVDRALALAKARCGLPMLVNFGGDLAASAARQDGLGWLVGVTAAGAAERAPLSLAEGGIASSGDQHRYLLRDGRRYSHILNPRTGWAVVDAPRTVTVCAGSCTEAGALATLALLHGAEAESYLRRLGADARVEW